MLTRSELLNLLDYDSLTGEFIWRITRNGGARAGDIAGATDSSGHRQIKIRRRCYAAHRLAWLYAQGRWPIDQIDHIDGNRQNNAIANLREANNSLNQRNAKLKPNASGMKGVTKTGERWRARITDAIGRQIYIGAFAERAAAGAAYDQMATQLFGEFARTNASMGLL